MTPAEPLVLFAAATGLRPGEWIALEHHDLDLDARGLYVHRSFSYGRVVHEDATQRPRGAVADGRAALDQAVRDTKSPTERAR